MTAATAGWIVLGGFCAASLVLMLAGALQVARVQREFKAKLARLEEKQRTTFDTARLQVALARISRDGVEIRDVFARGQRALKTIAQALRYVAVTVRVVKLLT